MKQVGAFEAKTHLSSLLEEARKGACITITRHGVPMARLVPPLEAKTVNVSQIIADIRAIRKKTEPGKESIKELIEQGRRF